MEEYDTAQQIRNKLTEVEEEITSQQDAKRGHPQRVRPKISFKYHSCSAELQNAIESENYALAAALRDQISKLEAESLAA